MVESEKLSVDTPGLEIKQDMRLFCPEKDITLLEVVEILKAMKLQADFNSINFPDNVKRHFVKEGEV